MSLNFSQEGALAQARQLGYDLSGIETDEDTDLAHELARVIAERLWVCPRAIHLEHHAGVLTMLQADVGDLRSKPVILMAQTHTLGGQGRNWTIMLSSSRRVTERGQQESAALQNVEGFIRALDYEERQLEILLGCNQAANLRRTALGEFDLA